MKILQAVRRKRKNDEGSTSGSDSGKTHNAHCRKTDATEGARLPSQKVQEEVTKEASPLQP